MCDCFHLAFPNWHAASSGTGAGRRLRGPEPGTEDDSICDEPSQFTEGERPRPQGSSPVEEYPEKYSDSDKECEAEHAPHYESGSGKKTKKSGLGSMFEKRSTPKMSKLKEVPSPESGVIVKTAKDGCAEGLVYGGGGKDGIFIKQVVPESPASKSLKLKEGDQILSATVYFDNMSYEDAIQILEHAQAYKVKLCLKRQPDITETEPAIKSDVIPEEEEVCTPEMREQGKTKRRGDARISWPKFPSFGKGKKSSFARSHSSSEADEQRKLELSPTTSDTESPIKSQDALKGKKKQKIKLSGLKKKGRTSSSEDQETPTTGQVSGNTVETHVASPECLESPPGETPGVFVSEDLKLVEDLRQDDQKLTEQQTVQHKVELITIDSTLKTADLSVALADKESSSPIKSPDGKKKKKERSELKMKILGKDKSQKKDTKAKSSPKRLKTLGASIEIPDQTEKEKSEITASLSSHTTLQGDQLAPSTTQIEMSVPKVELDISDEALIRKSPQKGEEKMKKGKDSKQKQETKTGATFKLPKIGLRDINTEETIQEMNVNVEGGTTIIEQITSVGTGVKVDPYEQLSKSSLSRTQLPKREEIEIPGMEDKSKRSKAKGFKEPKAGFTGQYEELQAETVQLSIDVESVKEAVSKLPGYKLPKVDMSGMPIPEEITVIDANAQRISVKTPTKVVDTKTKHEADFTNIDVTASPEISKTTVKLPKITVGLTSEELLTETKVDLKTTETKYKTEKKQSGTEIITEFYKREDIIIPGKESEKKQDMAGFGITKPNIKVPEIGIHFADQNISQQIGERTIFIPEVQTSKTETSKDKVLTEGVTSDVKIHEIDGIEYIDSADYSLGRKDGGITGFGVTLDATRPNTDISIPEIRGELKDADAEEHTIKMPKFGAVGADISVNVPDAAKVINIDRAEIKTFERDGKGSKFELPNLDISIPKVKGPKIDLSLSKKDADVTLPEAKEEIKVQEVPQVDISLGNLDISIPEEKMEVKKPELEIRPLQTDGEQGSKLAITMPRVKGPEVDMRFSKKDGDVPGAEAKIKIPEEASISVDTKQLQSEAEMDVQGSKFKMPKLGITIPKVKGPAIDFSVSKKDVDSIQPEVKAEVKLPDDELKEPSAKVEIKAPEIKDAEKDREGSPLKFKLPTFKLPKLGVATPNISDEGSNKTKAIQIPETKLKPPKEGVVVDIQTPSTDIKDPSIDVKTTAAELNEKGSKFKISKFDISLPKVKGPEIDLSLSKKEVDVTLPEAKAEVKLPDVEPTELGVKVEVKAPEFEVRKQDVEGSPSKYKMPTFKLPKFGVGLPDSSVKAHDMDKDLKVEGDDIKIPEKGFSVNVAAPSVDTESASIEMKTTGTEEDEKGSKFKMPNLGFSMPKVKGPKIDLSLSKKDTDVALPEADLGNVDVEIPEAKMEIPEAKAKVKLPEAPKIALEMEPPQSEAGIGGHGGKFKTPKFGIKMPKIKGPEFDLSLSKKDVDVKLPETEVDVKLPEVDLDKVGVSIPQTKMEVKKPELEMQSLQIEGELDERGERFKIPKFGMKMPKVKGPEFDLSFSKKDMDVTVPEAKFEGKLPDTPKMHVSVGKAEVLIPEAKAAVEKPELKIKPLHTEAEGQGSKFKMPKFGMGMPRVKGPEFHLGFSKTDADVTGPEAKADVNLPDVEVKEPSIKAPEFEVVGKDTDGLPSTFRMPSINVSLPKVKESDVHLGLSKKDTDITLPAAEVKLPGAPKIDTRLGKAEVLIPETKVEVKKPEVEIKPLQADVELEGKGGKFKMPKFGITMPKVKGPEIDLSFSKKDTDVKLPEAKAEAEIPEAPEISMEMKPPQAEADIGGQGSKFKVPKFGISLPKVKGPDINVGLSKKDIHARLPETKAEVKLPVAPELDVNLEKVDTTIPEAKIEVKKPELEIKPLKSEGEIDGQGGKFQMPKFGISVPKVKGPEIGISSSKEESEITLPEIKADISLPDVEPKEPSAKVEIKTPKIEAQLPSVKGSPSKFKMPTFKFPKFGVATANVSTEVPDTDKEIKTDGADMHISVPHTDVDGPEIKAQVHVPEVEVKELSGGDVVMEQPGVEVDAKMKKPRFSLPKFSFSKPSVKAPEVDDSLPDVNVAIPEGKAEEKGEVDVKPSVFETEVDGQGSKFKMPKFGITMPKIKGPEIDLSFSKKEIDVEIPEARAEGKIPDLELKEPSVEVGIKAPDIKLNAADIKIPEPLEGDVEIDGQGSKVPKEGATVDVTVPSIDTGGLSVELKAKGGDLEGSGGRFKMPKFGISMPKVKGPEINLSLSKKDVDVTLPEAKAEVTLPDVELKEPSAEVEVKAPEIKVATKSKEGSPLKFKMPTFSLPKFGGGTPSATPKVPETDKDVKIKGVDVKIPEEVLTVAIAAPGSDTEGLSIDMKTTETEGKGSKFKMPSLGFSAPQVKQPDIDLSLSKKDVDVALPEVKAEVQLTDAKLEESSAKMEIKAPETDVQTSTVEGSPSKFKMPTFKLPKFGAATPQVSVEVPDVDKDITVDGASLTLPQTTVEAKLPDVELKEPVGSISVSQAPITEGDAKLKKTRFTLPKFSFSKQSAKEPEVDLSLPDARVSLPEANVEVKQPEVELKPSEVDAEIDGQGSKFKIPKFGVSMPKVKGPKIDLSLSKKDEDVNLPEAKAEVQLPDVHIKGPSGKVEITAPEVETKEVNVKGSPSKLKMPTFTLPKFGAATPEVSVEVPDVDKDIKFDRAEMKVPKEGATVDVTVPNVDTDGLSVEVKAKESELEGSGSKFKIPKFGISMPKVKGPEIDLSLSKKDVDKTLPEAKAEVKIPDVKLKESSAKVEIKAPEVDVQTSNIEESPSKFKMPSFKLPKFGAATPQVSVEVPDVDKDIKVDGANLTLPQTKAEVKLPDINLKESSAEVEVKAPEIKVETKKTEGSPLKFKMPTFSLPKFGGGTPSVTPEVPKTDKDVKIKGPDVKIPEEVLTVAIAAPGSDTEGLSIDMKTTETEGKGSKFKMPSFGFSASQVKQPDTDLSLSKKDVDVALPEVKAEVKLPDVKVKEPSVDVKASEVDVQTSTVEGSPSKFKMPSFKLPKFGAGTPQVSVEVPDVDKDIKVDEAKLKSPKTKVEAKLPEVEIKEPESDAKLSKTKFSLSKFSFSKQSAKETEVDVSLPDAKVSLPGGNVKVKEPEVELKPSEGDVEIDGQGSKFKFPKFGVSMPKTKEQKDVDVTLPEVKAEVQLPDVKIKGKSTKVEIKPETETKTGDVEGSPSKLKMPTFSFPKFGATTPKVSVEVPDVDKDIKVDGSADVTSPSVDTEDVKAKGSKFKMLKFGISTPTELPEAKAEVKLPSVEVKQSVDEMSVPDASEVDTEAKLKQRNWTFPKFSFSKTSGNAPDADVNLETSTKVDVTSPKAKAEADVKVQGPSGTISVEEQPATELDANLKKTKFSLPRFSLSKSSVKEPEVSAELPHVDVSLPEGNVVVKQPEMEIKAPETDAEHDVQVSRFKFPKFGITTPKAKGPEGDSNASQKEVGIALPEVKVEVTLPEVEVKTSANKDIKASETEAESKEAITDTDMPKTETDGVGQGSPSKFKMPSFKMPKLSFTRTKPEDENVPVETESKENQQEVEAELKGETKSAKMTLTSFGEILRNIDVEFDVSNTDKDEKDPEPSKEVHETDEPSEKQLESKKKETKQDTIKSPERTGWFKFPKFGLSSPSEPAKASEKDEHKDEKSPVDVSQTGSVQSSDAFADISSAVTSEHVGLSLSSPTKVTVKYSGPDIDIGLGEVQSNIITSTARTELISVEPNLPEKITIQSSGVSSSSEDTLKLESGKIHVITSNIQATPESQQANLLTSVQERHLIRETSSGRSENKETIVITKQITHVFDSSEPISGETASSIQRLKDSVHSEKMRFFGGTKK